jgi:GNAT superfamily N-acetyltransferase
MPDATTTPDTTPDAVTLRDATPGDIPTILALVRELAEYERDPDAAVATPELLYAAMFGPRAVASAVMAEDDGTTLGFALYFFNFSTWTGRPGLYLEDFYVRPAARGRGIGTRLFRRLAQIARERNCGRMELSVLNWNTEPQRLYTRLGGQPLDDWTTFRFDERAIARLAGDE